ncbi:MAG: hypothetical protein B6D59_02455 [Campylobacteraceae bacterium 4484_4]|nr:MAG: hypothetical protein B6D59_02455 [Campylobacteraceae bacterium 4484_4]
MAYRIGERYDWRSHSRHIDLFTAVTSLPDIAYSASALTSRMPAYERTPLLHYPGQKDLATRRFVYEK